MKIETTEDLCNELADMLGIYGCCKHAEKGNDCNEDNVTCCRVGFMMEMPDRMRAAVQNEEKILKHFD